MRSIMKKKLLPSVVAVAMGLGLSSGVQAIELAEDGVGQVLLAPFYTTLDGWKTRVSIVNTRNDAAVKVKVVLRSEKTSTEVLNFLCYMTPSDVCTFEIRNKDGQAAMYSTDDSIKSDANNFASVVPVYELTSNLGTSPATLDTSNLGQPLFDHQIESLGDRNEVGHIEIFAAYAVVGNPVLLNTAPSFASTAEVSRREVAIYRGMPKPELNYLFNLDADYDGTHATPGWDGAANRAYLDLILEGGREADVGSASLITSAVPDRMQLTGYVEIVKEDASDRMGYRIPALAASNQVSFDTGNIEFMPVIGNDKFDVNVANETAIGANFGATGEDNINYIEAALAKSNVKALVLDDKNSEPSGINRTRLMTTFPTRYRHKDGANTCSKTIPVLPGAIYTPPFQTNGSVLYSIAKYDTQEHTPTDPIVVTELEGPYSGGPDAAAPAPSPTISLPYEVNYYDFDPQWLGNYNPDNADDPYNYENGWFTLNFTAKTGCEAKYVGVPSLTLTHKYYEVGGETWGSWFETVSD